MYESHESFGIKYQWGFKRNCSAVMERSRVIFVFFSFITISQGYKFSCTEDGGNIREHSEKWEKRFELSPPKPIEEKSDMLLIWSQNGRFMDWRAPDGSWLKIELAPASNIPGEETPCLGKAVADEDSRVAVSGCQGDKEVAVTIASRKIVGGVVDLVISDGVTFEIRLADTKIESYICDDGDIITTSERYENGQLDSETETLGPRKYNN